MNATRFNKIASAVCLLVMTFTVVVLPLSAAAQSAPSPLTQIHGLYKDAVVFINVEYETAAGVSCESGTGFLISSSGYVLTSRHLITDENGNVYEKYSIAGSVGASYDCNRPRGIILDLNYVRSEPEQDVMLLKIEAEDVFNYVRACQQTKVDPGEKLYVLNFALGKPLIPTEVIRGHTDGPMGRWQMTGIVEEGASGSPVLNASGRLVGLVFGGYDLAKGYEFMVPLDHFKHLFGFASAALENCATPTGPYFESKCAPNQVQRKVEWTLSEHKGLQTTNKGFRESIPATPGKVITAYEWRAMSASGASGVEIDISDDKKSIGIRTQLSSGPIFDQWRGWVNGILILSEIPEECQ